jgi:undecaprenyl-diphosphatase
VNRSPTPGARRTAVWCAGGFLLAIAVGVIYARQLIASDAWSDGLPWERALLIGMHTRHGPVLDWILLIVPWFGTNITMIPLVVIAAIWLWRHGRGPVAIHILTVVAGSFTMNLLLKHLYDRPRPTLWEWRGQFAWASYPSGHSIASVAVPFTIALLLHRGLGWRWPFPAAATLLIVTVYSRLYLGVHWPSDVIVGLIMGMIWLLATHRAFRPLERSGGI